MALAVEWLPEEWPVGIPNLKQLLVVAPLTTSILLLLGCGNRNLRTVWPILGRVAAPRSRKPVAALFAQKSLSILLDTRVCEEQHHLEVSPLRARLPLGSPRAVSLIAKLRVERQEGSTSSASFSPLPRDLTLSDPTDCTPKTAAVPRHNTRARLAPCEDRFCFSQRGEH